MYDFDAVKEMRETMLAWCKKYPVSWVGIALELAKEKYFEDREREDNAENDSGNGG